MRRADYIFFDLIWPSRAAAALYDYIRRVVISRYDGEGDLMLPL